MTTKAKVNIREEGWQAAMLRTAIQWQMVKLIRHSYLNKASNDFTLRGFLGSTLKSNELYAKTHKAPTYQHYPALYSGYTSLLYGCAAYTDRFVGSGC